jgi:hypothetical protein
MTRLVILKPAERRRFDSPPILSSDERSLYFSLGGKGGKLRFAATYSKKVISG